MKISIYGRDFLLYIGNHLIKDGHDVVFNKISPDSELIITQSKRDVYKIYRNYRKIKRNKIKIINFILDIPPYRLEFNTNLNPDYVSHSLFKEQRAENNLIFYTQQALYHFIHRNPNLHVLSLKLKHPPKDNRVLKKIFHIPNITFNVYRKNRFMYLVNYRNYLKKSDLNLSISKYTQKCVEKFLKLKTDVCHHCVNSDYLLEVPKPIRIEYDALNIGRIVERKRQEVFVEAAKKLGLKFIVLGNHEEKSINLGCEHYYVKSHEDLINLLNKAKIFVDPTIFEGFGMPPVEAAFLDKIIITTNIYVHREILRDYPIYFKPNDVNDLVKKLKMVGDGNFSLNKATLNWIKKEYSIESAKNRLLHYIESIF